MAHRVFLFFNGDEMTNRYVVINISTGLVENMILWDGNVDNWQPDEGYIVIQSDIAQTGWSYLEGVFTAPPIEPPPPLTPEQILTNQSAKLQGLTQLATAQKSALTNRIGTLNDAIELEMATPAEEAELLVRVLQLKAWKTYAVLLGRVTSQTGWPPEVEWPVQPTAGMDLTVSAAAPEIV